MLAKDEKKGIDLRLMKTIFKYKGTQGFVLFMRSLFKAIEDLSKMTNMSWNIFVNEGKQLLHTSLESIPYKNILLTSTWWSGERKHQPDCYRLYDKVESFMEVSARVLMKPIGNKVCLITSNKSIEVQFHMEEPLTTNNILLKSS